jgi:hypothetical protein
MTPFRLGRAPLLAVFLLAGCAESQPEFVSKADKFAVRFRGSPR